MRCERCGAGQDFYEASENVVMVGSYTARLCNACRNAFHEYVNTLPLWAESVKLELDAKCLTLEAEVTKQMPAQLREVVDRRRAMDAEWFTISKQFVQQRLDKPKALNAVGQTSENPT